jgi:hypothetical protein
MKVEEPMDVTGPTVLLSTLKTGDTFVREGDSPSQLFLLNGQNVFTPGTPGQLLVTQLGQGNTGYQAWLDPNSLVIVVPYTASPS